MQIAICDDEYFFRKDLKEKLLQIKKEKRIAMNIFEYESGEDLLSSNINFDMIFMDYQMDGLDGLRTAKIIRAKNFICSIIFITAFPHFILDSFAVQPFRFLIKPLDPLKIDELIDSYITQQKQLYPIVVIEDGEQKTVNTQDIIYLEGDGKYCIIRTSKDTIHSSKTLSQVYNLLPEHCFFRTHKSYVVNLYCVSSFKNNIIRLINDEVVIIGRKHIKEFKNTYMNFVKNYYVRL